MQSRFVFLVAVLAFSFGTMAQDSESFELEELYKQAAQQGGSYLRFIDNERLSSGIYQLKKGEEDKQEPHQWDELYYIIEGRARLVAGDKTYEVAPGTIHFVKANVSHRFIEIREDLKVLVFFSKKE